MIDIAEFISRLTEQDVRLSLDGDELCVDAPTGVMTTDRVAFMREHRQTIIDILRGVAMDTRLHRFSLRAEPSPDEQDANDPDEGRRIVKTLERLGAKIVIKGDRITLQWFGDISNAGELIDEIRKNRLGIAAALSVECKE